MSINYSIPKKYRNQKPKSVFSFSNFRGIDKENKPVKVLPFRATDGYNFIIDSDTLKTRPSYQMETEPSFTLGDDDYIIGWHQYGTVRVYVTRFHFYFEENGASFNEQASNPLTFTKGGIPTSFNFEGKKPHFQEEKNALFIFCLGGIYVFSKVSTRYVFYELRSKPANPYNPTATENYDFYEGLPKPYEPTIWVDDKAFDDVNLLSNVSKYQLFAASQNTHNGETTYVLPTHYDKDKHGVLTTNNIDVTFYKERYGKRPEVLPVFLGISKDNFPVTTIVPIPGGSSVEVNTVLTYGSSFLPYGSDGDNTANEIPDDVTPFAEIRDIYYPPSEFTYFGDSGHQQHTPISENYGLTKEKFFRMAVANTDGITVFQYLMDYIANNSVLFNDTNFTANKWVSFKMKARVNATFYDNNSSVIKEKAVLEKTTLVYVQLKKFESDLFGFTNNPTYLSNTSIENAQTYTTPFTTPTFPTGTAADFTFYINPYQTNDSIPSPVPSEFNSTEVQEFITEKAKSLLIEKSASVVIGNNQNVKILGKFYQEFNESQQGVFVSLPSVSSSNFNFNALIFQSSITYPSYPSEPVLTNPTTLSLGRVGSGSRINFSTLSEEYEALVSAIASDSGVTSLSNGTYSLHFQATGYKEQLDFEGNPQYATFALRVIATVSVSNTSTTKHRRYAVCIQGPVSKGTPKVKDTLYKIDIKEEDGEIRFKLKDYFFDFNNEPTIDIKVTFEKNTDYNIIQNSNFGITFGSENRLFLAGNAEYPNIDRFNVSNDLLGDGVDNQSYELTYFPSKNYRVLGGKGAINGYVVATDSELYITKEEYPNDDRFFIRQRILEENGVVGYKEYKTNIRKTPLNNRCIVRFYNDILVLAKDGLYGIEIASNVLTNERLVKLRSGFINNELKEKIANFDNKKIFIAENDRMMYIFIGKDIYVADSRYIAQNPNSEIENLSYEIIKWTSEVEWLDAKVENNEVYLLEKDGCVIYTFAKENFDEYVKKEPSFISPSGLEGSPTNTVFTIPNAYNYIFSSAQSASNYAFSIPTIYKSVADAGEDYTHNNGTVTVLDTYRFAPFTDGDTLYWEVVQGSGTYNAFTITGFEATNRVSFTYGGVFGDYQGKIYQQLNEQKLYITQYWSINNIYYFRLSPFRPISATLIVKNNGETDAAFLARIAGLLNENEDYYFSSVGAQNALIHHVPFIKTLWVSAITDFGDKMFEKTSFKINFYATKQQDSNNLTLGYRTLRRLSGINAQIDLSNEFNLENVDYSQISLATMDTVGFSLPMKENNFLYIQFVINGTGKIELNSFEVLYKANRMIKSIG
ncbi:MAG: hypothetical protein ACO3BB_00125 [Bacilli bacterium]